MRSSPRAHQRISRSRRWWGALAVVALVALAVASSAVARRGGERGGDGSRGLGHYTQRDLVSDVPGAAELHDADLVNAWGLAFGPATPAWVADNGQDVSTLYSGATDGSAVTKGGLTVSIPGGAPTGTVYNASTGFVVHSGTSSGAALFLFASEAGIISGWSPSVPPPAPSTQAQVAVTVPGAVFKGLAIADTATGPQLYATDFHNGRVDVWDAGFAPVQRPGAFEDPGSRRASRRSGSRRSTAGSS